MKRPKLAFYEVVRVYVPSDYPYAHEIPSGSYGYIGAMGSPGSMGVFIYDRGEAYVIDAVFLEPTGYRDRWYSMGAENQEDALGRPWHERLQPIEVDEDIISEWKPPSEE